MLKKITRCLIVAPLALSVTCVLAAGQPGPACAAKQAEIESNIAAAQARGNAREVAGLQKALEANQRHCTDEGLAQEHAQRVEKAQKKVAEREAELAKAQSTNKQKKIDKAQQKLDRARADLDQARQRPLGG